MITLPEQLDKLNKEIKKLDETMKFNNQKLEIIAQALGIKLPKEK